MELPKGSRPGRAAEDRRGGRSLGEGWRVRCCVSATKAVPATYDPATATTSVQPEQLRFNRITCGSTATPTVEIPVMIVVVTPIDPEELVVTIPAALVNLFEKASAIFLYLLCLFINRQVRLQVQVKHLLLVV